MGVGRDAVAIIMGVGRDAVAIITEESGKIPEY